MRKLLWVSAALIAALILAACTTTSTGTSTQAGSGSDYVSISGEIAPLAKAGFSPLALTGLERTQEDENTGRITAYPVTEEMKVQLTEEEISVLNNAPAGSFIRVYVNDATGWMSGTWFNGAEGKYDNTTTDNFKFSRESGRLFVDHEISFFINKMSEGGNSIAPDTEVVIQKWGGDFLGIFLYIQD